jgi:hypothetical protein
MTFTERDDRNLQTRQTDIRNTKRPVHQDQQIRDTRKKKGPMKLVDTPWIANWQNDKLQTDVHVSVILQLIDVTKSYKKQQM